MKFSLIVSTLGRFEELLEFVKCLTKMKHRNFELIIVDQNKTDRIKFACEELNIDFGFIYLHTANERGLSRGRNRGIPMATGDILCFPDDDCIYPPNLLSDVLGRFEDIGADIVCGRAATPEGRSINGRFEKKAQFVTRNNVFSTQIEWVVFFRRQVLVDLIGFDVDVGVGATTPWQACEGPEITLRALAAGFVVYYDPQIYAFHAELTGDVMARKVRGYARGMGYVFRIHQYKLWDVLRYFIRPIGGFVFALARFNINRAKYYVQVMIGRVEGFYGNCIGSKT